MNDRERLVQIVQKAKEFRVLASIPEFVRFRTEVIEEQMKYHLDALLASDTTTEVGRQQAVENLWRYQQFKTLFVDLFSSWETASARAQKTLRKGTTQKSAY